MNDCVPPTALEEWLALSDVLTQHGPVGCETSAMPEAWWSRDLEGEAQTVCRRCPARLECLGYAIAADERYGVWGGLTERERARGRRR